MIIQLPAPGEQFIGGGEREPGAVVVNRVSRSFLHGTIYISESM